MIHKTKHACTVSLSDAALQITFASQSTESPLTGQEYSLFRLVERDHAVSNPQGKTSLVKCFPQCFPCVTNDRLSKRGSSPS